MSEKTTSADSEREPETTAGSKIVDGVVEVVEAVLQVGASLSRSVAEAVSGERPVPQPSDDRGPIAAIVHYGSAVLNHVVHTVLRADAPSRSGTAPAPASAETATPARRPTVEAGATLRIPLSIENPGNEPMEGIGFSCLRLTGDTLGVGAPLDRRALRFEPRSLTVAPHDFEKLTVYVDTAHDTDPGRYEAVVGLGSQVFEVSVYFDVLPQGKPREEAAAPSDATD